MPPRMGPRSRCEAATRSRGQWAVALFKPGREDQCGKIGAMVNVEVRELVVSDPSLRLGGFVRIPHSGSRMSEDPRRLFYFFSETCGSLTGITLPAGNRTGDEGS